MTSVPEYFPPPPKELVAALDERVVGHSEAKRGLAVALALHQLGSVTGVANLGSPHILLAGPTGSGKSLLLDQLVEHAGLPYSIQSATRLAETGIVGTHIEEVVADLRRRCEETDTNTGIVVIDELDKIAHTKTSIPLKSHVLQSALLTALDDYRSDVRLLFVFAGAFENLKDATTESLYRFGILRELLGRIGHRFLLHELGTEELVRALRIDGGALARVREILALYDCSLEVREEALELVARRAAASGLGARGLYSSLDEVMTALLYRVLNAGGSIAHIVIEEGAIDDPNAIHFVARSPSRRNSSAGPSSLARVTQLETACGARDAPPAARVWWKRQRNARSLSDLLSLLEAAEIRGASVEDLFQASRVSFDDTIASIVRALDFLRRGSSRVDRKGST